MSEEAESPARGILIGMLLSAPIWAAGIIVFVLGGI